MQEGKNRSYLDVRGLVAAVWDSKMVGAVILLVFIAVGVSMSFLVQSKYNVEVLLVPAEQDTQGSGLEEVLSRGAGLLDLAGIGIDAMPSSTQTIALLSSRRLTADFVESNNLMPILFPNDWDSETNSWKETNVRDQPSIADAIEYFDEDIRTVEVDQRTGLITLSVTWIDAAQAAEWAMGLVQLLNNQMRDDAISESTKSLEFLNQELSQSSIVDLQKSIYSLMEQEVQRAMLANVNEEYALKVLDPPFVPDPDDYVWPNRVLFALLGAFIGLAVLLLFAYRRMDSPLIVADD